MAKDKSEKNYKGKDEKPKDESQAPPTEASQAQGGASPSGEGSGSDATPQGDDAGAGGVNQEEQLDPTIDSTLEPGVMLEGPPIATLQDLRDEGYVLSERVENAGTRDEKIQVVTRGGRKLTFPGDEERAAQLTHAELTGEAPLDPVVSASQLPPRSLEDLRELGCIAGERKGDDGKVYVVTKGGRKLAFPGDEAMAGRLTDSELDGDPRKEWPRAYGELNLFGRKPAAR